MAGILETIKLAAVLVFALPIALAGVSFLSQGQTLLGATLLGLAVCLVLLKRFLTTPGDVPGLVAKRVGTSVGKEPEANTKSETKQE